MHTVARLAKCAPCGMSHQSSAERNSHMKNKPAFKRMPSLWIAAANRPAHLEINIILPMRPAQLMRCYTCRKCSRKTSPAPRACNA